MNRRSPPALNALYERAIRIGHRQEPGLWLPKIRALALRGHSDGMIELADWLADLPHQLGSPATASSPAAMYRRAYRQGNARAAHNLAMTYFNGNDLWRYRIWIRRAGKAGDEASRLQAACFETRLPHSAARKIGRHRPEQRRDEFA